ncbi:hypothetical protein N9184_00565 [bacterium]|nr:hypothetical protein [bacterium]
MPRNFIIGTAGHIDHGKSTLVQTLTGTNPDRLPEEKSAKEGLNMPPFRHSILPFFLKPLIPALVWRSNRPSLFALHPPQSSRVRRTHP